ncbi:MAG: DUF4062 domain-containing protein [Candidatus Xenobiia bacterium LiM19]
MVKKWKTVKVFISSTFRDMHAERDYLVKVVFPELRERLEKHCIHLIDIDLRWGVTKEQAEDDRVLELCLQQIEECRPFFIGILGERYGWVPENIPSDVLTRFDWIQHSTDKSITALEIIHGVLQDPEMAMQSFFYFRDPSFCLDIPENIRSQVEAECPESAKKLAALKEEIRRENLPVPPMENYPCRYAGLRVNLHLIKKDLRENDTDMGLLEEIAKDGIIDPQEHLSIDRRLREIVEKHGVVYLSGLENFGDRVRDDLWGGLCRKYPEIKETPVIAGVMMDKTQEWLAEEQDYHERFVESRSIVYAGRDTVHNKLSMYVNGGDRLPMLLIGASGAGKSAVMGRLYRELSERDDISYVIGHFVGASPQSTNLRAILRRFCLALRDRFNLTDKEVPEEVERLPGVFCEFIELVPESERAVFIIDALNQMDKDHRAHEMYWLPEKLPAHVKIVVSCIEGEENGDALIEILRRARCLEQNVESLTLAERFEIVTKIPSLSAKTLDPEQVHLLLSNPATENPLFLIVALEELRGFGSFELLNDRIRAFPHEGDTVTAVFLQVLERLEEEHTDEVVREMLSLIAISRYGLSEEELRDLIKDIDGRGEMFVVLRQLRTYLYRRGEFLDFYHGNLEKAVHQRYLETSDNEQTLHGKLASYFHTRGNENIRTLSELPYHQTKGTMWIELESTLTDLNFIEAKCRARMTYDLVEDYHRATTLVDISEKGKKSIDGFGCFIRRHCHILHMHPELTFQQAANEPDHTFPAEVAGEYLSKGLMIKPWLCQINKKSMSENVEAESTSSGQSLAKCVMTLPGHTSSVYDCSISLDEKRIASVGWDGLHIWDLLTGERLTREAVVPGPLDFVKFTPDGLFIANTISGSGELSLIHEKNLNTLDTLKPPCEEYFPLLALSANGRIAAFKDKKNKSVAIFDFKTNKILNTLTIGDSFAFSGDSAKFAAIMQNGEVQIRETSSWKIIHTYETELWHVSHCALSHDGTIIAIVCPDGVVCQEIAHGKVIALLQGHSDVIENCCISPSGKTAVTCSRDKTLKVWDIRGCTENKSSCLHIPEELTSKKIYRFYRYWERSTSIRPVRTSAISHDGSIIVVSSAFGFEDSKKLNSSIVPDIAGVKCEEFMRATACAISPDGKSCLWGTKEGAVQITKLAESSNPGYRSPGKKHDGIVTACAFSPDGSCYASVSSDRNIRIYDSRTGRLWIPSICDHGGKINACIFSPDGRFLLTASDDGTLRMWEKDSGIMHTVFEGHGCPVFCCAFSPDGTRIISGSEDGTLIKWDVKKNSILNKIRGHNDLVITSAWFNDGFHGASASRDGYFKVWDFTNITVAAQVIFYYPITTCSITPDGRRTLIGTGDGPLYLYDLENI